MGCFTGQRNLAGPAVGTVFSLSVGLGPFVKTLPDSGEVGAAVKILRGDFEDRPIAVEAAAGIGCPI